MRMIVGDAADPQADGSKVIAHVCNDIGAWGKGFVVAISRRWRSPEADFRAHSPGELGTVRLVPVDRDIWIANMIGQHGVRRSGSVAPIRYDAVDRCLATLGDEALRLGASVHMPRIGCGLAGGRWERIEPLVVTRLCDRGIDVTVYDLP